MVEIALCIYLCFFGTQYHAYMAPVMTRMKDKGVCMQIFEGLELVGMTSQSYTILNVCDANGAYKWPFFVGPFY